MSVDRAIINGLPSMELFVLVAVLLMFLPLACYSLLSTFVTRPSDSGAAAEGADLARSTCCGFWVSELSFPTTPCTQRGGGGRGKIGLNDAGAFGPMTINIIVSLSRLTLHVFLYVGFPSS